MNYKKIGREEIDKQLSWSDEKEFGTNYAKYLQQKIDNAIKYIKKYGTESEKEINYVKYNNKEYCICASDFNEGAELILEILGDKE